MIQEPDEYNMEVNPPNRLGLARVAVDSSAFFEKKEGWCSRKVSMV